MLVSAYFSESGASKPGLSPLVDIVNLTDGGLAATRAAMTDRGKGFYVYDFTTNYSTTKTYGVHCDSIALTATEQYAVGTVEPLGKYVGDEVYEGSLTLKHIVRIMLSALGGLSNGGGTGTINFRDVDDSKNRITASVTNKGNRTIISLDGA